MELIPLTLIGAGVYLAITAEKARELASEPQQPATGWQPPERAAPYLPLIRDAENRHGLPYNLLARVLYQESRYRPDIIKGETLSSAGAVGIAQIVPRWHPDVDPLNVPEAINYAAAYLKRLYGRFGSWEKALAAYNWGQGNLSKVEALDNWLAKAPEETRNYVTQISGDVLV